MFSLKPVTGRELVGREQPIKEIMRVLKNKDSNTGYLLYGIRRVGKTSILRELEKRLKGAGIVVVYVSLWEINPFNMKSLLEELVSRTLEEYGDRLPIKYKIRELFRTPAEITKRILETAKIGIKIREDAEFLLTFKFGGASPSELFRRAFEFPEEIAKETKTKCVIILDEFPSILELKDGMSFIRALRSLHEKQRHVAFCISGSVRKTLDAVALSETSPFYKQFMMKEIRPLDKKSVALLLEKNFRHHGIKMKEGITDFIYELTRGIPFYVQFFGKMMLAKNIKNIGKREMNLILKSFLDEEGNVMFMDYLHSFSQKEQGILSAIVASENRRGVSEISKLAEELPSTVSTYLLYLIDKGAIEKKGRGVYELADPVFREWLRGRLAA